MIKRVICCLLVGLSLFVMAEVSWGQVVETNAAAVAVSTEQAPATNQVTESPAASVLETVVAETTNAPAAIAPEKIGAGAPPVEPVVEPAADPVKAPIGAILPQSEVLFGEAESRSQHARRVNGAIFVVSSTILTIFVLCRLGLLWQITQNRKKNARENSLES